MKSVPMRTYTLITGASAGIGRAMAWECARHKMNLILVALPGTGLMELTREISLSDGVRAEFFEIDLTRQEAPYQVYKWCHDKEYRVSMLINNAGIGYAGRIEKYTVAEMEEMIHLNIRALVIMTRLFIHELKQHPRSYILNMASLGCYRPLPYRSVYAASKAFVYNFTRAIRVEMKHANVSVSVCAPGGVVTNPKVIERIEAGGFMARISKLYPQVVASYTIKKLLKGRAVIVPGFMNRFLLFFKPLVPLNLQLKMLEPIFRNEGVPNGRKIKKPLPAQGSKAYELEETGKERQD
jgi:short-subunit dehydrogenase